MESLALLASLVVLFHAFIGPLSLGLSFTRLPGWVLLVLGFVCVSIGLYSLVGLGHLQAFIWLGCLDFGCGLAVLYRVFLR